MNRERTLHLYCETLREAGMLAVVFAALDVSIENRNVSGWIVLTWIVLGLVMLYAGVRLDPEVRK